MQHYGISFVAFVEVADNYRVTLSEVSLLVISSGISATSLQSEISLFTSDL